MTGRESPDLLEAWREERSRNGLLYDSDESSLGDTEGLHSNQNLPSKFETGIISGKNIVSNSAIEEYDVLPPTDFKGSPQSIDTADTYPCETGEDAPSNCVDQSIKERVINETESLKANEKAPSFVYDRVCSQSSQDFSSQEQEVVSFHSQKNSEAESGDTHILPVAPAVELQNSFINSAYRNEKVDNKQAECVEAVESIVLASLPLTDTVESSPALPRANVVKDYECASYPGKIDQETPILEKMSPNVASLGNNLSTATVRRTKAHEFQDPLSAAVREVSHSVSESTPSSLRYTGAIERHACNNFDSFEKTGVKTVQAQKTQSLTGSNCKGISLRNRTYPNTDSKISEENSRKNSGCCSSMENNGKLIPITLFASAKGKSLRVKESALTQARELLSKNEKAESPQNKMSSNSPNSLVATSKSSLKRTNDIMAKNLSFPGNIERVSGSLFFSAKGDPIAVKKSSLDQAREFVCGIENGKVSQGDLDSKEGCESIARPSEVLKKMRFSTEDNSGTHHRNPVQNRLGSLFTTAKGDMVAIKKASLNRARQNLRSIESAVIPQPALVLKSCDMSEDIYSPHSKKTKVGTETCSIERSGAIEARPSSVFSTAKGDAVTISKTCLDKALTFVNSINDESSSHTRFQESAKSKSFVGDPSTINQNANTSKSASMSLFSTAKGEAVKINQLLLQQARKKIESADNDNAMKKSGSISTDATIKDSTAYQDGIMNLDGSRSATENGAIIGKIDLIDDDYKVLRSRVASNPPKQTQSDSNLLVTRDNFSRGSFEGTSTSLFSSARGSPVKFDSVALEKARQLVESVNESTCETDNNQFQTFDQTKQLMRPPLVPSPAAGSSSGFKLPLSHERNIHAKYKDKENRISSPNTALESRGKSDNATGSISRTPNSRILRKPGIECSGRKAFKTPFKRPNCQPQSFRNSRSIIDVNTNGSETTTKNCNKFNTVHARVLDIPRGRQSLKDILGAEMNHLISSQPLVDQLARRALSLGQPHWLVFELCPISAIRVVFDTYNKAPIGFASTELGQHIGWRDARSMLLASNEIGVNPTLATELWVANHYRWIVWKLGSLQRLFPSTAPFRDCFSWEEVNSQLLYRYQREFGLGHRPALRRVFQKDLSSACHMVLCVSQITSQNSIVATDGWYGIECTIDSSFSDLIKRGRLRIGGKFHVCGASMVNNDMGMSPLEAVCNTLVHPNGDFLTADDIIKTSTSQPRLMISRNCTLPADWDTKLGLQPKTFFFKRISDIVDNPGTLVPCLEGLLFRKFPLKFAELDHESGRWVFRTASEEENAERIHRERVEAARELIFSEMKNQWVSEDTSVPSQNSQDVLNEEAFKIRAEEIARRDSKRKTEVEALCLSDPRVPGPRESKPVFRFLLLGVSSDSKPRDSVAAEVTVWSPNPALYSAPEGTTLRLRSAILDDSRGALCRNVKVKLKVKAVECVRYPADSESVSIGLPASMRRSFVPIASIPEVSKDTYFVDTVVFLAKKTENYLFFVDEKYWQHRAIESDVLALDISSLRGIGHGKQIDSLSVGSVVALRDIIFQRINRSCHFVDCRALPATTMVCTSERGTRHLDWRHLQKAFVILTERANDSERFHGSKDYINSILEKKLKSSNSIQPPQKTASQLAQSKGLDSRPTSQLGSKNHQGQPENKGTPVSNVLRRHVFGPGATLEQLCAAPKVIIPREHLIRVQLGRQTMVLRPKSIFLDQLRAGQIIVFTDGPMTEKYTPNRQAVRLTDCSSYSCCSEVLQVHGFLRVIDPTARSVEEALSALANYIGKNQPVISLAFDAIDVAAHWKF